MPRLSGVLQPEGALVTVEIGLSRSEIKRLRQQARAVPGPVSLVALLDTGAECSCVDSLAVASLTLPLKNIGLANIPALGGLTFTVQRDASLTIIHPAKRRRLDLVIDELPLAEVSLGDLGYAALIGRGVLSKCRFLYDGQGGRFRLLY